LPSGLLVVLYLFSQLRLDCVVWREPKRAGITYDADAPDPQQPGKGLPDRPIQTGVADAFEKDRIGLAQNVELRASDFEGRDL
jgi:hypothetical protein